MNQRLAELGQIDIEPVHRRRHEQVEILGEEEGRERRNHVGEQQDRQEGQEHEAEQLAGEQRPDLLYAAEVAEHPVQHDVDALLVVLE